MARALVTGVQGQTGYYLAEALLEQGWEVHGTANIPNDIPAQAGVKLHAVDFSERGSLAALLTQLRPELIINLAAISSVAEAWKSPTNTLTVNTIAVAEIAEYVSTTSKEQIVRVVQASSAEIFGNSDQAVFTEETPIAPINPYAVSKAASHLLGKTYRHTGVWWSNAILFNHESPRRPLTFLSRKVSHAVARISLGLQNSIELGDLSSQRDWGWAPDYARAISLISQQERADDFIVATGVAHSVQDYVRAAFAYVGIENWQDCVTTNPEFIRPTEVKVSVGDSSKLKNVTGWEPTVSFQEMVGRMVQADIDLTKQEIDA